MLRTRLNLAPRPPDRPKKGGSARGAPPSMGAPCLSAAQEVTPSLGSQGWPVDNGNRHSAVDSESTHTVNESRLSIIPEPVSMRSMMNSNETPPTKWRIPNWRRFLPYIGGIAALLLFAAALVILHSQGITRCRRAPESRSAPAVETPCRAAPRRAAEKMQSASR